MIDISIAHIISRGWKKVVFSADCDEDGNCPVCGVDYAECGCIGPTMDGYEYHEFNGELWAKKIESEPGDSNGKV